MKKMKYQKDRIIELLDTGKCCGYTYYILNLGTHPTAYINIPENHKYYGRTIEKAVKNYYSRKEKEENGNKT